MTSVFQQMVDKL